MITSRELFQQQAPSFNFELDEDQLLATALERGYLEDSGTTNDTGDKLYIINEEY